MLIGLLAALGAGMTWGLVFVAPVILLDYPPAALSFGRYIAFGLIALVLALFDLRRLRQLCASDWKLAAKLALVGNLIYYLALSEGIQLAGPPLSAMIIGTLPVVIAIFSNRLARGCAEAIAWKRLIPSLGCIGAGLALVNWSELQHLRQGETMTHYVMGALVCLLALAAWTLYPIVNARHLKRHPQLSASTWATAQGLMTLPLACLGYLLYGLFFHRAGFDFPLGARPALYLGLMCAIGLFSSWAGTLLWNKASQRLPSTLSGQLIVFETLFALIYAYCWRQSRPDVSVVAGGSLLCIGVTFSVRVFSRSTGDAVDTELSTICACTDDAVKPLSTEQP